MDKEIKKIQLDLDSLLNDIDGVEDTNNNNIDDMERNIQEFYENYESIEGRISQLKENLEEEEEDGQKPLINKLKSITNDMDRFKKKLDQKNNKLNKLKRESQYFKGELTGVEKKKAEKEIALGNIKKTNDQGEIINDIHLSVKQAGSNLLDINTELNKQGEVIDRVQDKVLDTKHDVGKTGKVMSKIEFRNQCMKVMTLIAVIIMGLFDVAWVGFLLYRKFG